MSRHSITDEEILKLAERGLLKLQGGEVVKRHRGWGGLWKELKPNQNPKDGRWRYNLHIGRRQRTIYRNRLLWILQYRSIPDRAYDIDHLDRNNQNDDPANLALKDPSLNRGEGNYPVENLHECLAFFEALAG